MTEQAAARTETPQAPAARLGAELRDARRAQGWDIAQLANSLRIRQSYLEAIESGRISDLPGTTYALGFVRAYASALGVPAEEAAKRFRAEAEQVHGRPALHFPAPVPRQGVPAGALMLLGGVILAGAYGGWYWVTEHRATPVEVVPPIPDRLATHGAKPAPSPQVASILPNTAPPAAVPPAPPLPAATAPKPQADTQAGSAPAPGITTSAASVTTPPASAPPPVAAAPAPGTPRIVVKATADAWVTVKQPNGPALLNKIMHAGDSWDAPPDKTGLLLTTGNAGGTEIDVDGKPIPTSLGTSGAVRRDIPLDPDLLKSGQLPPPKPKLHALPAASG
jgi:cytoskeleton protein RodZ